MSAITDKIQSLIPDVQAVETHRDQLIARADALDATVAALNTQLASNTSARDTRALQALLEGLKCMAAKIPYVYGGSYPSGLDCSALCQRMMSVIGVSLPRTSINQSGAGAAATTPIIGTLLFFDTNGDGKVNHVGFCLGGEYMLHTATKAEGINVCNWVTRYKNKGMYKNARNFF